MRDDVEIVGLSEVDAALLSLADYAGRMPNFSDKLSLAWYGRAKAWLDSEGRGSFVGLTEAYAAEKAKRYGAKPILDADGSMKAALTSKDAPDAFYEVTDDSLTMGAIGRSGEIASYHQTGTDKMPKRSPYDSLIVEEFKNEDVKQIIAFDLSQYARELSLNVQVV